MIPVHLACLDQLFLELVSLIDDVRWYSHFLIHFQFIMATNPQLQTFTTSSGHLNITNHLISLPAFIGNLIFDIGIMVAGVVLWKLFWHTLNKLSIRNLNTGRDEPVGQGESIWSNLKCLHVILKNLTMTESGYLMQQCGFEAFTYMFFLRRFTHLMAIFSITDIFVWIPYQLIFTPSGQFSLVSTSSSNYLFRTFYTIWVTVVVLYGINDMKAYLRLLLKNKLFRSGNMRLNLINNLKSKTVYIHFARENRKLDLLEVKTRLVQKLRIEDSIMGIIELPNNSKKIELEYEYKIFSLVKWIGVQNFNSLWHFFKYRDENQIREELRIKYERLYTQGRAVRGMERFVEEIKEDRQTTYLNSYLVAFENISTPEELMNEIQSKRNCCDRCIDTRQRSQVEHYFDDDFTISISWAQEPGDVIWINIGAPQKVRAFRFVLFNVLSGLLIFLGFLMIVLAQSSSILTIPVIPSVALPFMLSGINSALRWLISKSSQWENQHFQSEMQMKEMKVLMVFFAINVIGGSIVRDTTNLVSILTTGWGFIEFFGLIYRHPDGFFYYGYIANQMALTFFSNLYKIGDLFPQVFDANFTYEKDVRIRFKSRYGTNDPFRYGYMYALDIILFAVIFMYSASTPLIHFFGFLYFYSKFYSSGYSFLVVHKKQQTHSNLRMIEKVCEYIVTCMILIIFLIGVTLMFEGQYSSVLILYLWEGVIIYIQSRQPTGSIHLKDYYTDDQLRSQDRTQFIKEWKAQYIKSMQPMQPNEFKFGNEDPPQAPR